MSTPHRPPSGAASSHGGAAGGTAPGPKTGAADVVRIPRPRGGPGHGGPFAGMNVPAEKAMNFWPSARRLLGTLRPERAWLLLVLVMGISSVALSVIGPRLLGEGTNLIFAGVVSKQLPPGVSKDQLIAQLRAAGENQKADMLTPMALTPGEGIDFAALSSVLLWALVLYVLASAFMWVQAYVLNGVVQRTVFGLREEIEAKIHRLPLRYFDSIQRG
ncbi:MAG TPA: ABC transporter transmembrane domain-containing protein, partial [Arthrobacter sp.]|nr:ABC transporter transmembrane domain-containing protein [Arthrobacter sp.]